MRCMLVRHARGGWLPALAAACRRSRWWRQAVRLLRLLEVSCAGWLAAEASKVGAVT